MNTRRTLNNERVTSGNAGSSLLQAGAVLIVRFTSVLRCQTLPHFSLSVAKRFN